jgi:hypothetical protein
MRTSVNTILTSIRQNAEFPKLSSQDMRILKIAAQRVADLEPEPKKTTIEDEEPADGIPDHMHLWEQEVQKVENFVNTEI